MDCWPSGFEMTEPATNGPTCNLKNGLCQSCIAVAKVNEEINQAVATLQRLVTNRRNLRSAQNRTHDLMHRLPVELKNHIFELLLPLRNEWGEIRESGSGVMPSYLASICTGWRDIVWSNPFLWSELHIVGEESLTGARNRPSSQINFVRDWILRSRTSPLTIHVVDHSKKRSRQVLTSVLDATSQCSSRLRSLSLDIPYSNLEVFQRSDLQWHLLTRLRIISFESRQILSFLNPTASPEKIELGYVPLKVLRISWNRLTSANIRSCKLEDLANLFQHASQLTDCRIASLSSSPENFSMPPIIHHRLKILSLSPSDWVVGPIVLGSLTLPCLQEFDTAVISLLPHLPALVHRSSCPLTRLTLSCYHEGDLDGLSLPGVTVLILEDFHRCPAVVEKLLLEEYFPNLRHLTLRLKAFLALWDLGVISLLLDRKRPRPDGPKEGRLDKFLVVEKDRAQEFNDMWNSVVGKQLKALNIGLRDDGFEFL